MWFLAASLGRKGCEMSVTSWRVFLYRGVAALVAALFVAQTARAAPKGEIPIPAATLALMAARHSAGRADPDARL
jgi:hypothetical protein